MLRSAKPLRLSTSVWVDLHFRSAADKSWDPGIVGAGFEDVLFSYVVEPEPLVGIVKQSPLVGGNGGMAGSLSPFSRTSSSSNGPTVARVLVSRFGWLARNKICSEVTLFNLSLQSLRIATLLPCPSETTFGEGEGQSRASRDFHTTVGSRGMRLCSGSFSSGISRVSSSFLLFLRSSVCARLSALLALSTSLRSLFLVASVLSS